MPPTDSTAAAQWRRASRRSGPAFGSGGERGDGGGSIIVFSRASGARVGRPPPPEATRASGFGQSGGGPSGCALVPALADRKPEPRLNLCPVLRRPDRFLCQVA